MKRKLSVILLVGMMALSMTACGSKETKQETKVETSAPAKEAAAEEEAEDEVAEEDTAEEAKLTDLESQIVDAYMGITEAGEGFYYAGNEDGSLVIILVANPETKETVSFVGKGEQVSETQATVTDDATGNSLTFGITPQQDGTVLLDLGDLGQALIAKCETSVVLEAMQAINDHGIPVM